MPLKTRKSRATGTTIQTWSGDQQSHIPGAKYILLCVEHDNASAFDARRAARDAAAHPMTWCATCAQSTPVTASDDDSDDSGVESADDEEPAPAGEPEITLEEFMAQDEYDERTTRRRTETATMKQGDVCKVTGTRGTFTIKYIDQYVDAQRLTEVTVFGGVAGHPAWHTYTIDRIKMPPKRRNKKTD
jgi:hypothetical protein